MSLFCSVWICLAASLPPALKADPTAQSFPIPLNSVPKGRLLAAKKYGAKAEFPLTQLAHQRRPMVLSHAKQATNVWDVQYMIPIEKAVRKGDVLYVYCRVMGSGFSKARLTVCFQQTRKPWAKDVRREFILGRRRINVQIPFVAQRDAAPGEAALYFMTGYAPQSVVISEIKVVNFGPKVDVTSLPETKVTYAGREQTDAWRAEAARRIDKLRKANLTVQVRDAKGKPIPAARVRVEQQAHAYRFGSAIAANLIAADTPEGAKYRALVLELFNTVTIENALKWKQWPTGKRWAKQAWKNLDTTLAWCKASKLRLRGHCLVWAGWGYLPPSLAKLKSNPAKLRETIAARIAEAMAKTRGLADEWDVLNEPFTNRDLQKILGPDAMAEWFHLARKANPNCRLFLNEYHILSAGGRTNTPHQAHFETTARTLLAAKAPLDALGMQCHFAAPLTPPKTLWSILDRYAKLGLPIEITELDVSVSDPQLHADYLRDFMTAMFAHRATTGIVMWGFWEGRHWKPAAALYNRDFTPRPAAKAYRELVFKTWWTRATEKTSAAGDARIRAFKGTHKITVTTPSGKTFTQSVELTVQKTITVTVK